MHLDSHGFIAFISCETAWVVSHDNPGQEVAPKGVHNAHAPVAEAGIDIGAPERMSHQLSDQEADPDAAHIDLLKATCFLKNVSRLHGYSRLKWTSQMPVLTLEEQRTHAVIEVWNEGIAPAS